MTEDDLKKIHHHLEAEINDFGGKIDAYYHCPQLASESPNCRKPSPSMGLQAQAEFPEIDFKKCIMVGDSISDMEFGKNLGMTTVFISDGKKENIFTDFYTTSLTKLASLVER